MWSAAGNSGKGQTYVLVESKPAYLKVTESNMNANQNIHDAIATGN